MLGFAGVCNILDLKSVQQVLYELSKLSLNGEWLNPLNKTKAKTNTKDSVLAVFNLWITRRVT